MAKVSKRDFLALSAGAVGAMVASGMAVSRVESKEPSSDFQTSGLSTGNPKPLKYKSLPGFLSAQQIAPHFSAHYGGALKAYVKLDGQLEKMATSQTPGEPLCG